MASSTISLGIGSPASVPFFLLLGLHPEAASAADVPSFTYEATCQATATYAATAQLTATDEATCQVTATYEAEWD